MLMSQFGMRFDASKVVTLKMYCLLKYRFILLCGAAVVVVMTSIDPGTKNWEHMPRSCRQNWALTDS